MQRTLISLLAVATGFFGTASAAPQAPQISECSANCFLASYPELRSGCHGDSTYMTCICKDSSKLNTVKGCLSACSDESSQQIAQVLSPEICGSTQPGGQPTGSPVVTVTDFVTVPCTTSETSKPSIIVPPVESQSQVPSHPPAETLPPVQSQPPAETQPPAHSQPPAETQPPAHSQPPAETQPPAQTQPSIIPPVETQTLTTGPSVIIPIAGTTGAIPTPGTNTTITTGQPTQPSTPAVVPTNQPSEGGTAGKFGVSFAVAALAGAVGIFAAL